MLITMSMAHRSNKPAVFDANVWLGSFLVNDSLHKKAASLFEQYEGREIIVPEYILLEVVTIIKQQVGYQAAQLVMKQMRNTEECSLLSSSSYFAETAELFLTLNEKHLSFVDVSLVVLAKDFEVVTLDKQLAKVLSG